MAYRGDAPPIELVCPRCKKTKLPPLDVAECTCGTWVSAFAASELLTENDRFENHLTHWWRIREPCPVCAEKMALFGKDPNLLQGCWPHGYFIDADTVAHTGLGRGIDWAALERKRGDEERVAAERAAREAEERRRAIIRAEAEQEAAAHARAVEARARIERLVVDDDALIEALRPTIGTDVAMALVRRLSRIETELERLARIPRG